MIFKCKMCGGALEITEGVSVTKCPYCGARQTLPRLDNEKRANLYDRAGHFRRMSDFDKAMALYEEILKEDSTDAEAYWSIVLCRYGIEYVEDPAAHRRIPTVNRVQLTSILADEDYKSALTYADAGQRELYEAEAKEIEEIQKGILAISEKEEPFDVFICYKETDDRGVRTRDSVLANDLYYELTNEGYKVFFSRITLEDKLGTAYEPYIFAALRSAPVMVVVGTKPEYLNSPWVKNEWSRYLALIRAGEKKTLIPAYRDMDPYDLPDAFSHLQAQDMSKLGFMQDLTRGIRKLLATGEKKTVVTEAPTMSVPSTGVVQFLKRARVFLEDGDWKAADEYIEHALDSDPEDAEAYLLKLLVTLHLHSENVLGAYNASVAGDPNYIKALRYSKGERHQQIAAYETQIQENIRARTYQKAQDLYNAGSYSEARSVFLGLGSYKDAKQQAAACIEAAKLAQKEKTVKTIRGSYSEHQYNEAWLVSAIKTLETIIDYAPAAELRQTVQAQLDCLTEMRREREEQERRWREEAALQAKREAELRRIRADKMRQKAKEFFKWAIPIATVVAILLILAFNWWIPAAKYNKAERLVSEGDYTAAAKLLQNVRPGFRDCDARLNAITTIREMDLTSGRNLVDGITYLLASGVPVKITYETAGGILQSGKAVRLMASTDGNDAFGTATVGENAVCFYQNSSDFSELETVARDGYQFLAWEYVAASLDFSGTEDFAAVTLRAAWAAEAYSLSFRLDGGETGQKLPTQYGAESKDITILQPTKKGYTFIGWTGTGLSEPVKEFCIPAGSWGNRSYTAVWQANTYTLTLDANGGSCDSKTVSVVYGCVPELPEPVWSGHTFSGWYCGTKEYSSDIYTEDNDLTLTAAWDLIQYSVIYHLNGGENAANNVSQYNVLTGLSLSAPTRKGYSFVGWTYAGQDTPDPNVVFPAGTVGAREFTAVWQANRYTLILDADGGLCDTKSVFAVFDAPVELPTPSRIGYIFLGWYNGQSLYNGENWTLDGGATLVARWKARTDVAYRVEHYQQDAVGDGYTRAAEQLFTGTADNAVTPAPNTYTGFITPAAKTITIAPDGSLVVKYYYTREVYTATAVVNGGGAVPARTARYQAPLTMDVPVRNGFTFGGWYTDANLTKAWNGSLSDHTILFACWSEETNPCDLGYTGQTGANGYQITQYTGTSATLWIPAYIGGTPVTAIADHAFDANTQLTKIVIPDAVTSIGEDAFSQCVAVTEAILPAHAISFIPQFALENVTISSGTDIPGNAFKECRTLLSIILPAELQTIGNSAFLCCSSLTDIRIPDSVDTIGEYAFAASGLTNITLPLKLTSISESLFNGCDLLQTVSFGDHVTEIGQYAFYQCKSLLSVPLSTKLTSVGDYAFYGCEKIVDISLPGSLKVIGSVAFGNCKEVRHICVPDTVVSIGSGAFSGCEKTRVAEIPAMAVSALPKTALESVTITSGDSIANSSFKNCKTLTSVIMADSVTGIGEEAFSGCTALKTLHLGNSIVSIGNYAFRECSGLTCVTIPDSTTTIAAGAFEKVNLATVTLPANAIQSIPKTALKSVTITSGESINESAFANCITLEYIAVAGSVTTIDAYAFSGCSGLKSITMPDGVLSLGEYVFANCTALEQITLADSVTTIGAYAFRDCTDLTSVHLPVSIDTISSHMFYGCSRLTSVMIPEGVLSIGMNAFAGCVSLEMVELTDGLQTIMYGAFQNCSALTSIVIPDSVTVIGESIISGCSSLKAITCPYVWSDAHSSSAYPKTFGYIFGTAKFNDSTRIEQYYCSGYSYYYYISNSLTSVRITSGELPYGAFYNCTGLTSITVSEGVTSIGEYAFSGCTGLTSITIPSSVTNIGEYAFSDCNSLSSVIFEDTNKWLVSATFTSHDIIMDVVDSGANAENLVLKYYNYYWRKA